MPAIDLLFDVKPSSERLHQMVLGALLVRTELLLELVSATPVPDVEYEWEPRGGRFDLGVQLEDGGMAWFELKVDAHLGEKQVRKQVESLEEAGCEKDRLLYLLLGTTKFQSAPIDAVLASKEHRTAKRVSVHTSDTLRDTLGQLPIATALGGDAGDARSLVSAYRAILAKLERRNSRFEERDPDDWEDNDLIGLYHALTERVPEMKQARFGFAPNPGGGRMVCWWGGRRILEKPEVTLYPQWEVALHKESGVDTRLCFKISVEEASGKLLSRIRNAAWKEVRSYAAGDSLQVEKPDRFGHGKHMTVAVATPRPVTSQGIDWDLAERCAVGAMRIIRAVDLTSTMSDN